jgi:hypothetical protein
MKHRMRHMATRGISGAAASYRDRRKTANAAAAMLRHNANARRGKNVMFCAPRAKW